MSALMTSVASPNYAVKGINIARSVCWVFLIKEVRISGADPIAKAIDVHEVDFPVVRGQLQNLDFPGRQPMSRDL